MDKNLGDCMAACIASILELPLEQVPNFREQAFNDGNSCNTKYANKWLHERGLAFLRVDWHGALEPYWRGVYCVCNVPSQKFEGGWHYVVGLITDFSKLEIVHDPKTSNERKYNSKEVKSVGFIVLTGLK